jgi:hypothetical protein
MRAIRAAGGLDQAYRAPQAIPGEQYEALIAARREVQMVLGRVTVLASPKTLHDAGDVVRTVAAGTFAFEHAHLCQEDPLAFADCGGSSSTTTTRRHSVISYDISDLDAFHDLRHVFLQDVREELQIPGVIP